MNGKGQSRFPSSETGTPSRLSESGIRLAHEEEAELISRMIMRALRQTNLRDYEQEDIERLAVDYSPEEVACRMRERRVYVAFIGEALVGTASLSPERVNSVFVEPTLQGRGIGARMMEFVEDVARREGRRGLSLSSSLTAVSFYRKLGYEGEERKIEHGVETVLMAKALEI